MFGKKLLATTFGIMLVSNCAEATDDFKNLNLPMLEKKVVGDTVEFAYSSQSVLSCLQTQSLEMPSFNEIRSQYGDEVFLKIAGAYFSLENDIRYTQFGFALPQYASCYIVDTILTISNNIYTIFNTCFDWQCIEGK